MSVVLCGHFWYVGLGLTIVIFMTKCILHSSGSGTPPGGLSDQLWLLSQPLSPL